jgi:hypothetical protein
MRDLDSKKPFIEFVDSLLNVKKYGIPDENLSECVPLCIRDLFFKTEKSGLKLKRKLEIVNSIVQSPSNNECGITTSVACQEILSGEVIGTHWLTEFGTIHFYHFQSRSFP